MSERFALTPEAEGDILNIWRYIADDSVAAADRVVTDLFEAFDRLAEMPGMGHFRKEILDERHRFWSVFSYLIVYRWQAKPLQILAVVHGSRDLDAFLDERLGG